MGHALLKYWRHKKTTVNGASTAFRDEKSLLWYLIKANKYNYTTRNYTGCNYTTSNLKKVNKNGNSNTVITIKNLKCVKPVVCYSLVLF